MSWSWTIQKAAVEQEILFPSKNCYKGYIETLTRREEPYEVVRETENPDGTLLVIMRKRYNNNFFLPKAETGFSDNIEKILEQLEKELAISNGSCAYGLRLAMDIVKNGGEKTKGEK